MSPAVIFLLLFIGIPLTELYFLIEVGAVIGAFPTIILIILTAVLGGALVRRQGFSIALRVRVGLERNEVPALELLEGVILLASGIFLLLPGFFTDLIGFICLIPPVRQGVIVWLLRRAGTLWPAAPVQSGPTQGGHKVIEGEYKRHDD